EASHPGPDNYSGIIHILSPNLSAFPPFVILYKFSSDKGNNRRDRLNAPPRFHLKLGHFSCPLVPATFFHSNLSSNARTSSVDSVLINSFLNSLAPLNPLTYILKKRRRGLNGRGSNCEYLSKRSRCNLKRSSNSLLLGSFGSFSKANGF